MNKEIIIYSPKILIKYKVRVDILTAQWYERFESDILDYIDPNITFQTIENELNNGKLRFNLVSEYTIENLEIKQKIVKGLQNMYLTIYPENGSVIKEINKFESPVIAYCIQNTNLRIERMRKDTVKIIVDRFPCRYVLSDWNGERLYIKDENNQLYDYMIDNKKIIIMNF